MDKVKLFNEYKFLMFTESSQNISKAADIKYQLMPDILYKYKALSENDHKALDLLLADEAYVNPPIQFNDIFECPIDYDSETLPSWMIAEVYDSLGFGDKYTTPANYDELFRVYKNELKKDNVTNEDCVRILLDGKIFEQILLLRNRYTVLCLSESYDNELMWAHYTNCNRGFCIGYGIKELTQADPIVQLTFPVEYDDSVAFDINDFEKDDSLISYHSLLVKSKAWSYEKEWRIFYIRSLTGKGFKIPMPKPKVIYAGYLIDSVHFMELGYYCQKNNVLLYRMKPDMKHHRLIPERIPL